MQKITRYRLKAEAILYKKEKANQLENKALKLEILLAQIEEIREDKAKFNQAKPYMSKLNKLINEYDDVYEYKKYCTKFKFLLMKIDQIHIVDPGLISKYSKIQQTLHSSFLEYNTLNSKTKLLDQILFKIADTQGYQKKLKEEIEQQQQKLDDAFIELGYCPFCNRKVKDGDTCCR